MRGSSLVLLAATSAMVALSIPAGKFVLREELGAGELTFLRYGIAAVFLLAARHVVRHVRGEGVRSRVRPLHALVLGGLLCGYQVLFYVGLDSLESVDASVLAAQTPLVSALLAGLLVRERLPAAALLGVVASVAATSWYLGAGRFAIDTFEVGHLFIAASIACWSLYAVAAYHLRIHYSSFDITLASTVACALLVTPVCAVGGPEALERLSWRGWLAAVYMGIAPSGIAILFLNRCLRTLGTTITTSAIYGSTPFLVGLIAWGTSGTWPGARFFVCASIVLLALVATRGGASAQAPRD